MCVCVVDTAQGRQITPSKCEGMFGYPFLDTSNRSRVESKGLSLQICMHHFCFLYIFLPAYYLFAFIACTGRVLTALEPT